MQADALILKNVSTAVKILSSHGGRDKLAKTLHYGARILYWYHLNHNNKARADQVEAFRQAIGNSRRVGRFLSTLNGIPTLFNLLKDLTTSTPFGTGDVHKSKALKFLLIVANVSDMFYYFADNITYAAKYGFINMSKDSVYFWEELVGSWSWLISMVIYIYDEVLTYRRLIAQRRKLLAAATSSTISSSPSSSPSSVSGSTKASLIATNEEIFTSRLNLIKYLADLQLAIFFCFPNTTWPSHWVGLFGVINAVTGAYQMWRSISRTA